MNQREKILQDILWQIAYNGGRVNIRMFIMKAQLLYGRTEEKIIEYIKLLESLGKIKEEFPDMILTDKSRIKAMWKPKKTSENQDLSDDPEALKIDKMFENLKKGGDLK